MFTKDCIDIDGFEQRTLAVSAVAAETPVLQEGVYDVWCSVDVFIRVGIVATGVTTANGYKITAGNVVAVKVPDGRKLGAIAGGAGTLSFHRVG